MLEQRDADNTARKNTYENSEKSDEIVTGTIDNLKATHNNVAGLKSYLTVKETPIANA